MASILLIEDDNAIRQVLSGVLTRMGHTVSQATNGVEGLRKFRDAPADLVITDLVMPEKEGIETILELRSTHPHTKIIAMSGALGTDAAHENLRSARLLGATKTLLKPFHMAEFAAAIEEILGAGV